MNSALDIMSAEEPSSHDIVLDNTYIALGFNPEATILLLSPITRGRAFCPVTLMLANLKAEGFTFFARRSAELALSALGAYKRELDSYPIITRRHGIEPFSIMPPPGLIYREVSTLHVGLDMLSNGPDPVLTLQAYDGQEKIGQAELHSLRTLSELGPDIAPGIIGESILRKLAALHPGVLALD